MNTSSDRSRPSISFASRGIRCGGIAVGDLGQIQISAGTLVMAIQRTNWTSTRPMETAGIVVPVDRHELLYVIPVEGE